VVVFDGIAKYRTGRLYTRKWYEQIHKLDLGTQAEQGEERIEKTLRRPGRKTFKLRVRCQEVLCKGPKLADPLKLVAD